MWTVRYSQSLQRSWEMSSLHTLAQGLLVEKDNTWLEEVPLVLDSDQIKTEHTVQHSIRTRRESMQHRLSVLYVADL